jgi:hypothetical protein
MKVPVPPGMRVALVSAKVLRVTTGVMGTATRGAAAMKIRTSEIAVRRKCDAVIKPFISFVWRGHVYPLRLA